jgi:ribosomal protein L24E
MILRATELAIQGILQAAIDDNTGSPGAVPVLLSDEAERKPQMPYVVIQCISSEEQISPGCGIFKVEGDLVFKSHTREMSEDDRQVILDSINNFAYDATAAKLSGVDNFHCHGWYPTTGTMSVDNDSKATIYEMRYWIYCMAMDN